MNLTNQNKESRKILFHLGHPAHFHMFKNVIENLKKNGNQIMVIIKKKDILEDLLKESNIDYINILPDGRKDGMLNVAIGQLKQDYKLLRVCKKHKPDILVGTSVAISHVGKLLGIPSINFNEDDANVVPLYANLAYPWASCIVSPVECSVGKWKNKKVGYNGYQKLAYLHPNWFVPKQEIVEKYFDLNTPYYLIRFAKLTAHHDTNVNGINASVAQKVINILEKKGRVFITSERALEPQFEKYSLKINPLDIHHIMYFADVYIGDSQSMSVEAAMLGTPSIRFSDFAGKISVLEELEHTYKLTRGFKTTDSEKMFEYVSNLITNADLKNYSKELRDNMLKDKIDVTAFFIWLIENYPKSITDFNNNPQFQFQFK